MSKEEEAAERERLRDAKALLQAQLKSGASSATAAALGTVPQRAAAAAAAAPAKHKVRMFAPGTAEAREAALRNNYGAMYGAASAAASGAGSGGAAGGSSSSQQQQQQASAAALEPGRFVTSADAYAKLLLQAGIMDSDNDDDDEFGDALGSGGGAQQDVVFIRGEDGVTMFAVCAGGAGAADSMRIANARHRGN